MSVLSSSGKRGSVLVVGGGIGGMQAALDLADSGFKVHLVQRESSIGGTMSSLDKTFPTGDCAMCMISPKMVSAGRHLNIEHPDAVRGHRRSTAPPGTSRRRC